MIDEFLVCMAIPFIVQLIGIWWMMVAVQVLRKKLSIRFGGYLQRKYSSESTSHCNVWDGPIVAEIYGLSPSFELSVYTGPRPPRPIIIDHHCGCTSVYILHRY
jgi:hypothetical protein